LSVRRLQEAVESEYGGHVTFRTYDARAILALLGEGPEPDPREDVDPYEEQDPDGALIA
jgi:hypothetical protein